MKIKFKDVEHLYKNYAARNSAEKTFLMTDLLRFKYGIDGIKPKLYPLSSMTENQVKYIAIDLKQGTMNAPLYKRGDIVFSMLYCTPKVFAYLLSQNFDIFGLIESGEAIDATLLVP